MLSFSLRYVKLVGCLTIVSERDRDKDRVGERVSEEITKRSLLKQICDKGDILGDVFICY